MTILVEPYDREWPHQFAVIALELKRALQGIDIISIEHVGSTSVPGLHAKPILDIDVIVTRENVMPAIGALERNLEYENKGEWGVPERWALRKPSALPERNLYVCVEGCQSLRNHLGVRDVLRADPALRDEYGRVKMELSTKYTDVNEYCEAKNDILEKILNRAGMTEGDRRAVKLANTLNPSADVLT
ncbi:UPF0157-domain-containing protein [Rhizodiscina lignyota]|uniref:UPF0157-domain-containing protein n=1 Tax=Rhizodiscina lignyota TaxID=1504668 RepID=A0A9P4M3H3_9PEZI|nr:UPF0157-domain-containing protein [Rhizodiscina lignyota]